MAAAKKKPAEARPYVDSEAPEQIRVEPGSIAAEVIRQKNTEVPLPVFSTMAMAHGNRAAGAATVRPGFAWNSQMDLLWALGFPDVMFIVDGFPAADTKQGILDYWNPSGREFRWWVLRAPMGNPRIISRRGAFAIVHELTTRQNPFQLSDDDFLRVTEPRPFDEAEALAVLRKVPDEEYLESVSLVLEALAGPSCIASGLCTLAESPDCEFRGKAVYALRPYLRRIPAQERDEIRARLNALAASGGSDPHPSFLLGTLDPVASARGSLERGHPDYALGPLVWADGQQDFIRQCYDARTDFPDVPSPRLLFAGGTDIIERDSANFGEYSDFGESFEHDYSTIQHPKLLGVALNLLSKKAHRDGVLTWLSAHADAVRPELERLASGSDLEAAAKTALKKLG